MSRHDRPVGGGRAERLGELDLLRFLAALAVVAFHYMAASRSLWGAPPTRIFPSVAPLTALGILGVELFFVISGFVILMSVEGRTAGSFAVSRFTRLFPAYWFSFVAIFLLYTLTPLEHFRPDLSPAEYLVNMTMLQRGLGVGDASGVYWSLWVELRFYVLIGLLALAGITLRRVLIFMGLWLVLAAYAGALDHPVLDVALLPDHAPYFVGGMAFYVIYRYGSSLIPWALVLGSWACAVRAATERVARRVELVGAANFPVPEWAVIVAITLIFGVMALVALGGLRRLRGRFLTVLGALTYPLYLLHQTVSAVFIPLLVGKINSWLIVGIVVGISLALSYAVWRLVERPAQRALRPRLTASLGALRAVPPVPAADPPAARPAPPAPPAPVPAGTAAPAPAGGGPQGTGETVSLAELLGRDRRGTV